MKETLDRLFIGAYPTGLVYADKSRELNGDYRALARLPYHTLVLEWARHTTIPDDLRAAIERDAAAMRARTGEVFPLSWTGNVTVVLGDDS